MTTRSSNSLYAIALALLFVAGNAAASGPQGPPPRAVADRTTADGAVAGGTAADSAVVALPASVDVRGVVRDANGSPIRGATIRLMSETDTVRVRSDGSGRFHARLTATRGVYVLVQAYGYRDLARTFRASGRAIEAALALPPPYPLGGVAVTLGGEPAWSGPRPLPFTPSQLELTC